MNLLIGKIEWYNDEFEIAIDDNSVNLGTNASINNMKPPPAPPIEWGKVDRPPTKKAPSLDPHMATHRAECQRHRIVKTQKC